MRLLVISQSLVQRSAAIRWRRLAEANPDWNVRLLVPRRWVSDDFGRKIVFEGWEERGGRFEAHAVDLTSETNTSIYLVRGLAKEIRSFAPDVIFPVHYNYQLAQTVLWRRLFARRAKLLFFTMGTPDAASGPAFSRRPKQALFDALNWIVWQLAKHGTDGAMCHNPDIERGLRAGGYRPPVLVQTQLGVDERVFHPDPAGRAAARSELGLEGFVVGFAGRVSAAKGILDIADAMTRLPAHARLLVVGDGPDRAGLERIAAEGGWRERLHVAGFVPLHEVARLMRAMDCLVQGSRTTERWVDTFPLVVAQAMATGIPVVGSDSGAIPFQLGGLGLVFHEGDVNGLAAHLETLAGDAALRERVGQALLARAREAFCVDGMNPALQRFFEEVSSDPRRPTLLRRLVALDATKIRRRGRRAWMTFRYWLERASGLGYPSHADAARSEVTRIEKQTLFRLARSLPRGSVVAEIGSYHGASSVCLAAAIRPAGGRVYCIDTWMNDACSDSRADVLPIWKQHTAPYADTLEVVRGYSQDVVERIPDRLRLLFIDGDHSYEGVKRDLSLYLPKLEGNGILVMHDWNHDGVRQAVIEVVQPRETARLMVLPNLYCCRVGHQTARPPVTAGGGQSNPGQS